MPGAAGCCGCLDFGQALRFRHLGVAGLNPRTKAIAGLPQPQHVSKSRFKAHALQLFRQIEATGEPLVIADLGASNPLSQLRCRVLHDEAPFVPVAEGEWEVLRTS